MEIKNNKYLVELSEYLKNTRNENIDLKKCAKLKQKAYYLMETMSTKLLKYISTFKKIDINVVESYIVKGADINYKFYDSMTLYMYAGLYKQLELMEFLKNQGADVQAKNVFHQNALMLVAFINNHQKDLDFSFIHCNYFDVIRLMRKHNLDAYNNYDILGNSLNDYYLDKLAPYEKTLKTHILKYFGKGEEKTF